MFVFLLLFFTTCVCVWLPEETLKLALKNVFNKHLFQDFWKGWMVLLRLWYVYDFVPETYFLQYLITGYDDSLRAVY